jgi:hypothetical protein
VPPLRTSNKAHRAGRPVNLLLCALPKIDRKDKGRQREFTRPQKARTAKEA